MAKTSIEHGRQLKHFGFIALLLAFSAFSQFAMASEVSIDGYSPVSYFTEGKAEKGSIEYSVSYKDNIYYLTSAEQVALFNENPNKYRPRYHYCAYSVVLGGRMPLDPTNFKVVGDTLLLFHVTEDSNGRNLWENSGKDDEELIGTADNNYTFLEF